MGLSRQARRFQSSAAGMLTQSFPRFHAPDGRRWHAATIGSPPPVAAAGAASTAAPASIAAAETHHPERRAIAFWGD